MGEPRAEEVVVCRQTYLFFDFGYNLAGEIVLATVSLVILVVLFVEVESEWVGSIIVTIKSVDEILLLAAARPLE